MKFDSARYYRLQDSVYAKKVESELETLTYAEKVFFLIDWLDMQVHNGGWHQWYHNWSADERRQRIDETIDALRQIGAVDTVILLERTVSLLDAGAECTDDDLLELNEDHWAQPDDLASLTLQWAEQRIREFRLDA